MRMDGETPANADNPTASRGQLLALDGARAGTLEGIERLGYDGTVLPVTDDDVVVAQITTRDIDRGNYRHYLAERDQRVAGIVPQDVARQARRARRHVSSSRSATRRCLPTSETTSPPVASRVSSPSVRAPRTSPARASWRRWSRWRPDRLRVDASLATELSGFGLRADMSRHPRHRHQPVGHDDRHESHGRPRAGSRGAVSSPSSTVATATSPTRPTACCTRLTAATSRCPWRRPRRCTRRSRPASCWRRAITEIARRHGRPDAPGRACERLPDAMATVVERRPEIGAIAQQLAPVPSLLGDRRQRHEPHRRQRAAHQAVRALLQGDRVRLDRGQEAHRPVVRAAHPRVCRRPHRIERRRRRQGSGDLPGAQGDADRDRQRGRGPVLGGGAGHQGAGRRIRRSRSCCPASPVTLRLRGGAGHRCAGAAAPRGACRDRVRRVVARRWRSEPTAISCCADVRPTLESAGARFFDGLRTGAYDGHLEASTAVRLSSLLRYGLGVSPARLVPGRVRQDRHARGRSSTISPSRSPAASKS